MSNWRRIAGMPLFKTCAVAAAAIASLGFAASEARAQQLKHEFINPSFGGNPFYSDHLLGIATIHRPKEPQDPPLTQDELLIRQIQSRLAGQVAADIETRIAQARPGETGEFVLGDQVVRFTRTTTETRVTFLNTRTGETSELVIPVREATNTNPGQGGGGNQPGCEPGNPFCSSGQSVSAEALLGARGQLGQASRPSSSSSLLSPGSLEIPLGPPGL